MKCTDGIISLLATLFLFAPVMAQQDETPSGEPPAKAVSEKETKAESTPKKPEAGKKDQNVDEKKTEEKMKPAVDVPASETKEPSEQSPPVAPEKASEEVSPKSESKEEVKENLPKKQQPEKKGSEQTKASSEETKKDAKKPSPRVVDGIELTEVEYEVYCKTNRQRARYGLPPLKLDGRLMNSARNHCRWMARRRVLQHTRANVAENIAMGQRSSGHALRSWMSSQGHRANILKRSYRRIGVAAYRASNGTIFWCQQFLY
jgi:uncharacterized protein YkwD